MGEKILVADNEITVSNFLKKIIEFDKSLNLSVDIANDINTFNTLLSKNKYAIILIDLNFANKNVFDFITHFTTKNTETLIIAMSATLDVNIVMRSIRSGAYDFVSKPFSSETIMLIIKNGIEKLQLIREKESLNRDIQVINDELMKANELISKQKEQIDNYLNRVLKEIEHIKEISIEIGQIKSFDTNIKNIFEKVYKIYNPKAMALLLYEKKKNVFIVKREKNYNKSFPLETTIEYEALKHYIEKQTITIDSNINSAADILTVVLPLEMGNLIMGILLIDIDIDIYNNSHKEFFEILRYMITVSIINSKFLEDSKRSYLESLMAFLILEDKIHKGIKKHSEKVASLSVKLAKKMKLSEQSIRNLQYAGLLHLLGLIIIPNEKFNKEYYFSSNGIEIKQAIVNGSQILSPLAFMEEARIIIDNIFENFDGGGIPNGKKGEEIPKLSRMLRLVGEYAVFKFIFKMDNKSIIEFINKENGKSYDPEIVKLFFNILKKN